MTFRRAWYEMLNGAKIKLPNWKGYWAWENNTIMIHNGDGSCIDIRQTPNVAYTFSNIASDDWQIDKEATEHLV